jgi:CheY-like chemotaxis protein
MHGPEAARIMREEVNYRGVILGTWYSYCLDWMHVFVCDNWKKCVAVIGITGNALPADMDFFESSGANQVVTKPLSKTKLMDALHRFAPKTDK